MPDMEQHITVRIKCSHCEKYSQYHYWDNEKIDSGVVLICNWCGRYTQLLLQKFKVKY